ncbi:hypothetical protein Pelo_10039 [Pelomyxa schiedti]|nr:hypothetical protein Pelo_10039 [Pelomyxa schiedti]
MQSIANAIQRVAAAAAAAAYTTPPPAPHTHPPPPPTTTATATTTASPGGAATTTVSPITSTHQPRQGRTGAGSTPANANANATATATSTATAIPTTADTSATTTKGDVDDQQPSSSSPPHPTITISTAAAASTPASNTATSTSTSTSTGTGTSTSTSTSTSTATTGTPSVPITLPSVPSPSTASSSPSSTATSPSASQLSPGINTSTSTTASGGSSSGVVSNTRALSPSRQPPGSAKGGPGAASPASNSSAATAVSGGLLHILSTSLFKQPTKLEKYRHWSILLDKAVVKELVPVMWELSDKFIVPDQQQRLAVNTIAQYLDKVITVLSNMQIVEQPNEFTDTVHQCLLECWHHTLLIMEQLPPHEIHPSFFNAIYAVMIRPELELFSFTDDIVKGGSTDSILFCALRYRHLLFSTIHLITGILSKQSQAINLDLPDAQISVSNTSCSSMAAATASSIRLYTPPHASAIEAAESALQPEAPSTTLSSLSTISLGDFGMSSTDKEVADGTLKPSAEEVRARLEAGDLKATIPQESPSTPQELFALPPIQEESTGNSGEAPKSGGEGSDIDQTPLKGEQPRPLSDGEPAINIDEQSQPTKEPTVPQQVGINSPSPGDPVAPTTEVNPLPSPTQLIPTISAVASIPSSPSLPTGLPSSPLQSTPVPPSPPLHLQRGNFPPFELPKRFMELPANYLRLCTKLLPVLFLRVPSFRTFICNNLPSNFILEPPFSPPEEVVIEQHKEFPAIFQWPRFHESLLKVHVDEEDSKILKSDNTWLLSFKTIFLSFLKELFLYVGGLVKTTPSFNWKLLPGYSQLMQGYFQEFQMGGTAQYTTFAQLHELEEFTLPNDLRVLNALMKISFLKTNAVDHVAIAATFGIMDRWFDCLVKHNKVLGPQFDVQFFCQGLDVIISVDHHMVLCRILSLIYKHGDIFFLSTRQHLFVEFFIRKHFFYFFLHWSCLVRAYYYQVLLFKLIANRNHGGNPAIDPNNDSAAVNRLIYSKIESYLKIARLRVATTAISTTLPTSALTSSTTSTNPLPFSSLTDVPPAQQVYLTRALNEWAKHVHRFCEWEKSKKRQKPQLVDFL